MIKEIEKNLKKYLPKGSSSVKKAMRYSVLSSGKRIRPILVIESALACGGNIKETMPMACALEFVHTYSLIHDDLPSMDNDNFRRGKPTCHKVFGEANAILAGDGLLTLAFNIIAKHTRPEIAVNIIRELSDAAGVEGMVGGQAMDLEFRKDGKDKNISKKIDLLKTAKLLEVATKIGALVARATPDKVIALQRFGRYLGLSFQMVDDHLDGERRHREDAGYFIEKAKKELIPFGKKADELKDLADRLLKRKK